MNKNKAHKPNERKEQSKPNEGNENVRQPDPETLNTTDPQEHMKGPISSMIHKAQKGAEHNDDTPKEKEKHEQKKNASGGDFINK
ncbi:MAG TPA: hypothetical protein VHW43_09285 [Puia sp.]|jgi:hypothetical protein|nr:hypothetical protein [Puia sp.]